MVVEKHFVPLSPRLMITCNYNYIILLYAPIIVTYYMYVYTIYNQTAFNLAGLAPGI